MRTGQDRQIDRASASRDARSAGGSPSCGKKQSTSCRRHCAWLCQPSPCSASVDLTCPLRAEPWRERPGGCRSQEASGVGLRPHPRRPPWRSCVHRRCSCPGRPRHLPIRWRHLGRQTYGGGGGPTDIALWRSQPYLRAAATQAVCAIRSGCAVHTIRLFGHHVVGLKGGHDCELPVEDERLAWHRHSRASPGPSGSPRARAVAHLPSPRRPAPQRRTGRWCCSRRPRQGCSPGRRAAGPRSPDRLARASGRALERGTLLSSTENPCGLFRRRYPPRELSARDQQPGLLRPP
jgi:hypothetical protein